MAVKNIPVADVRLDGGTQLRVKTSDDWVRRLAEKLLGGKKLRQRPVVFDDGENFWCGDGHHTVLAHKAAQRETVECEVREGTRRDAVLYSAGANDEHGLPLTREDKQNVVKTLLHDPEWSKMSSRALADIARVDHGTILSAIKKKNDKKDRLASSGGEIHHLTDPEDVLLDEPEPERRQGVDGKSYPAKKKATPAETNGHAPDASAESGPQPPAVVDAEGVPVPPDKAEVFAARERFDELLALLKQARKLYAALAETPGGACLLEAGVSINARDRWKHKGIETAILNLEDARPHYCFCPFEYADGGHPESCSTCRGRRWTPPLPKSRVPRVLIDAARDALGKGAADDA